MKTILAIFTLFLVIFLVVDVLETRKKRQFVDLPEEISLAVVGDTLIVEKNTKDSLILGFFHPKK